MMIDAPFEIVEYYASSKDEPSGVEMIEISERASRHFPEDYYKEMRGEMLRICIELAKNTMSKTKVVGLGTNDDN